MNIRSVITSTFDVVIQDLLLDFGPDVIVHSQAIPSQF